MPHIISDTEYRELTAYRGLGKSPEELRAMMDYQDDPAPLPMEEDKEYSGLLEEEV